MNCFNHREVSALAVCKSCGRATCAACARLADLWVVCSDECAVEAVRLQKTNLQAFKINAIAAKPNYLFPLFFVLGGLGAALSTIVADREMDVPSGLFLGVGLVMIAMGASLFARVRRLDRSLRETTETKAR